MRRKALGIGRLALLVFVAMAGVVQMQSPAAASAQAFKLNAEAEQHATLSAAAPGQGRLWGYWGKLARPTVHNPSGYPWGSYRATCAWLADGSWGADPTKHDRDNRLFCTVVLSHRYGPGGRSAPHGGSIVAQGLMRMPADDQGLFVRAHECSSAKKPQHVSKCWPRRLAITGGTGAYEGLGGHIDLSIAGRIWIKPLGSP